MTSPRIRHLVQPSMSVVGRNLMSTNEVKMTMTTTAFLHQTTHQRGLELLVSRLAVGMLRWSQQRTMRQQLTHEEMTILRRVQSDSANALDLARLHRLD